MFRSTSSRIILAIILIFFVLFLVWINRAYSDIAWLDQDNLLAGNMSHFYNNDYSIQDFYYRPPYLNCITLLETYLNCKLFFYNTFIETTLSAILLALITGYFIRSEHSSFRGWRKYVFAVLCCLIVFGLQKWQNVLWGTGWGATLCVFIGFICASLVHKYYLRNLRSAYADRNFILLYVVLNVLAILEFSAYFMPFQVSILLLMLLNYRLFRNQLDRKRWRVSVLLSVVLLVFSLSINFFAQSYSVRHGYDSYTKATISSNLESGKMLNMVKRPLYVIEFYLWSHTGNLLDSETVESNGLQKLMPFVGLAVILLYAWCLYIFIRAKKTGYIYSINLIIYTLVLYATITVARQGFGNVVLGSVSRYSGASFSGILGLCTFLGLLYLSAGHLPVARRALYLVPVILVCLCYIIADANQWRLAPYRKNNYTQMAENMKAGRKLEMLECPETVLTARKMMIIHRLNAFKPETRLNGFTVESSLDKVTSSGFYDEESNSGRKYRWTNGRAEVFLPNLYSDKDSIKLRLLYYLPKPDTPAVTLNDGLRPSGITKCDGGYEYAFPVCQPNVFYKVTISNQSYVPHQVNKDINDDRVLGLVFNSMSFADQ